MKTELAIPTSHNNLLQHLKQIHQLALSGTELQFLPSARVAEIGEHITHYQSAQHALTEQEAKLRRDSDSFRPKIARLTLVVRTAWRSQRARQKLDQLPLKLLDLYGIARKASPNPSKSTQWIHQAQRLVAGDAAATQAGFEPMNHPNLATLNQALLGTAEAEQSLAQQMVDLNKIRTHTNSLASTAKILLRKVALCIHLAMFKESKPRRREVMRIFGYKFRSRTPQVNATAGAEAEAELAAEAAAAAAAEVTVTAEAAAAAAAEVTVTAAAEEEPVGTEAAQPIAEPPKSLRNPSPERPGQRRSEHFRQPPPALLTGEGHRERFLRCRSCDSVTHRADGVNTHSCRL